MELHQMIGTLSVILQSQRAIIMSNDSWPTTRLSLLLQCQDPQADEAWDDFVSRYRPAMLRLIREVFRLQEAEAEDIAQNVLLKLIVTLQKFKYDPEKRFRAWLRTITRNAVRDTLRAKKVRMDSGSGDTKIKQLLDGQPDVVDDFADAVTMEIHRDVLQDAERLVEQRVESRTWKAYLAMREGRSARDVASEVGMSAAAIYKAKSKVLRMIREEISMLLANSS
jgi:RNA polymerase sigma-70 factor (ECF subfamily)